MILPTYARNVISYFIRRSLANGYSRNEKKESVRVNRRLRSSVGWVLPFEGDTQTSSIFYMNKKRLYSCLPPTGTARPLYPLFLFRPSPRIQFNAVPFGYAFLVLHILISERL